MSIFLNNIKRKPSLLREGISLDKNKSIFLHELEINGEKVDDDDDFTVKDEEDEKAANGEESPEDAAENVADAGTEENNPTEEAPNDIADDNDEDDFTLDDSQFDDTNTEDTPTDDTPTEDQPTDEAPADDNADTGDDDDDFTLDDNDLGGDTGGGAEGGGDTGTEGGEGGGDAPEGGEAPAEGGNEPAPAQPEDQDLSAAESEIYDSLTDTQKRIRTLQLKIDYKDFYDTINNTMIGINGIPKNSDNIDTIKKISDFLIRTKSILIDYVENNFDKTTYLENYANYLKFVAVFRTVGNIIANMASDQN